MDINKLFAPFPPDAISWRVGSTNPEKTKGLALAYIDARDVMVRLDEVCGPAGWQCEYQPMPNGTACCRIGILIGNAWVWKANGAETIADSEKSDAKEMAIKGSYSDAFKRAGVLWGVGRYLYDLGNTWVELEPAGRSFKIKGGQEGKLAAALRAVSPYAPPPPPREAVTDIPPEGVNADLWRTAYNKALEGMVPLGGWWKNDTTKDERLAIGAWLDGFKELAAKQRDAA